ncbi:MAG: polyphosphate kinase [SAR86 cluster bacterium BACL1 MAG-121105-bin34]|jgi:polyphosphate kinase|uniref:Polyphosphate kinase n=2 Tax=SAR86 cluster TaxID=62672 RepID=A0A0R2U5L4_9GAMM|nr:MAG: polyphosphate kinase [SAR86 cluster bacterium BACL1 MAG-120507-bin14]KRO40256.1 MAG: polyphosphate kinase [SAR86 cluster bacterium BACL1 MAG-120920-bin57]KRO94825.1 MAG: polyphosphate kinase [SAR86 cluster bacterium BACL1 MAG-120820-bin45]KRO95470.1 MAG: polyphosphate kinase [SAR86 cluster bacterium BACL1 MAG-120828-bin5]KRO97793.1 MAG: polyphosphate kinase [SAR86 cluster bacterium BACL1 MAG-120823-bin87]KRO97800.1 MAG: polyphosphate kinase [SAR86 cluster bacterium BACL1 MAG-120813-bin
MLISFNQKEYQKLNEKSYQLEKRRLQIELLKLQEDVIKNARRICIVFEGRDTAGKSSTFKFFSEYLIPKNFKYVNLGIPTKWESTHWFQRWSKILPEKGEIAFLDRSWYTRALTEPVMGYCNEKQYRDFMGKVIPWEEALQKEGIEIIKFYFSLSQDQQQRRMKARKQSELKYWKLSPNDERIVTKWDAFTLYKDQMFGLTSPEFSPWIKINANNKMIARLTALRFLLNQTSYENKKLLKPLTWSRKINNYKVLLEGVEFNNLNYDQYMVLTKYMDDEYE